MVAPGFWYQNEVRRPLCVFKRAKVHLHVVDHGEAVAVRLHVGTRVLLRHNDCVGRRRRSRRDAGITDEGRVRETHEQETNISAVAAGTRNEIKERPRTWS